MERYAERVKNGALAWKIRGGVRVSSAVRAAGTLGKDG